MTRLQDGLIWRFKEATDPNGGMPHQLGRVIRVNRKLHTVDVALRYGGTLTNVKVLKDIAGTNEGSGWLPDVDSGKTEDATPTFPGTGTNDSFCVVGYIEGRQREPYVIGFVPPPQFETSFEKINVTKFHNGMYMVVDDDGLEFHRPDGTYLRIGAGASPVLTATNASVDVPFDAGSGTATPAAGVTLSSAGGAKAEFKPDGSVSLSTPSAVSVTDSSGTFPIGPTPNDATVTTHGLIRADDQKRLTTQALGNITGAQTFNLALGDTVRATLIGSISVTLTNPVSDHDYLFEAIQDGSGSRTVTWTTTVKWQGGATPVATTGAGKKDIFLLRYDGTDYLGVANLNF